MLLLLAIFYQLYEYGFAEKNRIQVIWRKQTKSEVTIFTASKAVYKADQCNADSAAFRHNL